MPSKSKKTRPRRKTLADDEVVAAVAKRMREAREAAGMTQADLAEVARLPDPNTYSRYERGERAMPVPVLMRIASALGLPVGSVLDVAGPSPTPTGLPGSDDLLQEWSGLEPGPRQLVLKLVRELGRR